MAMVTNPSSGLTRVFGTVLAIAALLALLLAGEVRAAGPFEPNDSRETAHGPLGGDSYYAAAIETVNDIDWYYFYVKTYSQFDFASTMTNVFLCEADFYLRDKDGNRLESAASYFEAAPKNQLEHFYITLDPGRYYLEVSSCTGDAYKFKISPAVSLTTNRECGEAIVARDSVGPALAEVTADLNENGESLASARAAVKSAKGTLAKLNRRWEKAKEDWRVIRRKIKRHPGATRFQTRERRRLRTSRTRVNRTLAAAKGPAKRELATANETRAEVLAERAPLQALAAQHTGVKSQAEAQIAASC